MAVVQLGLVMLALTICSYNNVLQECLEDQGVTILFEVTSQLSENGGISTATRDRIKLLCGNISEISNFTQFAEFTDEQDCTDAVTRALDRIPEFNDTNDFQSSELLREECPELYYRGWLNVGLLGFAAFIMLVLSFTKRRHHFAKHIFNGYPGVIVPVNLLQSTQKYFIHIIIFGAMASDILSNILNPSADFIVDVYDDNNVWSSTLIFYAQVFIQSLYFAPLLACVHTPIKLVGFLFGLLYSCYFAAIRVMHLQAFQTNCVFFRGDLSHLYPIAELPTYVCLLIICVWYAFKTTVAAYEMYQWCVNGKLRRKRKRTHHYFLRVKKLLMRSSQECNSEQKCNKIVSFFRNYAFDSSFHYPLGFSSAVFIALICIYQLTFLLIIISLEGTRWLHDSLRSLEELFEALISPDLVSSNLDINFYRYFEDTAVFLEVILPLVPLITGIFCYVFIFLLVINVREDIKRLYAGDFSIFPKKKPTPTNILASGLRYMGYQVGYFVWTWVIVSLVLYVVALLVFLILLLLQIDFTATLNWAFALIIPTIISTVLRYAQIYFAKFAFMQDRGATLSLTNIQIFHWFQFMMIFFNVVVGLTSALLRNIFSLVFGLMLMPRLDRTVMMKGFERFDSGYKTYIGFMYMNLHQNNAVVNVFCLLLQNLVRPKTMTIRKSIRNSHEELEKIIRQLDAALKDGIDHEVKSRVSFNRWLLAYTLMKNPQLQELRGHCIAAKKLTPAAADDETETKAELLLGNGDEESLADKESMADDKEVVIITTTV